jgi:malonate transporter MadL subunit
MKIYGVALLGACFLIGKYLGQLLGKALGLEGDIGGVGFAMLLLMLISSYMRKKQWLVPESESGIRFWSAMYIPIIVAMAATQNVEAAFSGGWVAILAGASATVLGLLLVPVISRIGKPANTENKV